jgi:pimeloyl-ACP methyl ester carboxylesterase
VTTFALVHGAWHDGSCWELLTPLLEERGHRVVAPDLPGDDPGSGFEEYAEAVESALAGEDDVAVVGHSLGSDTIPLVAGAPVVRLLVYLCPRLGGIAQPEGAPEQWAMELALPRDELGRTYWTADDALRRMYPRLPPALARRMVHRLRPQADHRRRPYPLDRLPAVASAFVCTTDDELFRLEWARWAAPTLLGVEPVELPGGHFPMLERPAALAGVLCELAEPRR